MSSLDRRTFPKGAGQGAVATSLFGMDLPYGAWLTADAQEAQAAFNEKKVECDVLVVGGGFAGCYAAIKAKEEGAIAGTNAAKEAAKMDKLAVRPDEIARAKRFISVPRERKGGFGPRWITRLLQNTITPYFIYYIKKADRLQAALTHIEFMQEHLVPMLIARDPHELRLAHETRSMVLSAEFRLRSALFRNESRGNHYREDFPLRDDKNWLAWTKIESEQGKMTLAKVPIPKEWGPDESIPYEQRYPTRFPGE